MWHRCEQIEDFPAIDNSTATGIVLDSKLFVYNDSAITFATIQREIGSGATRSDRTLFVSHFTSGRYFSP